MFLKQNRGGRRKERKKSRARSRRFRACVLYFSEINNNGVSLALFTRVPDGTNDGLTKECARARDVVQYKIFVVITFVPSYDARGSPDVPEVSELLLPPTDAASVASPLCALWRPQSRVRARDCHGC